jgi:hypothetical protein
VSQDPTERGHHFLSILEEGKRFTTDILRENEALRIANLKLKDDLHEREQQHKRAKSADHERDFELVRRERDDALEKLKGLRAHLDSVEAENREFADRYLRIEKQNGNLASLYVATYTLHATLKLETVVDCVREIVINLIGSEMFGVYVVNDDLTALTLLAHEGLEDPAHRTLPKSGIVEQALQTGRAIVVDTPEANGAGPIACAPLVIHDKILGVIAIYRLLDHKDGFEAIDRELLDMLAGHAATAIYSARLHGQAERKLTTLQGFLDLIRVKPGA